MNIEELTISEISVDDSCIGCGLCVSYCSSVFSLNENNKCEVKETSDIPLNFNQIKDCVDMCPVNAISINIKNI
ncbi:MAG: ferredoxin [Candidatus Improbicoccus devescovinae]|nr:MAG: ferredoxin [Candidatus Improbicoccus devescovinae]